MTATARIAVLNLRTVAPYRSQVLLLLGLGVAIGAKSPAELLPALGLLVTLIVTYPFNVADKAGLETLYAVLPLPRRAVLYGHYAWAVASYLLVIAAGTALDFFLARVEAVPLSGRTFLTMLTLSWALFVINVAIQFPLLIRFGYTRASLLATTVPLAALFFLITKLDQTITSNQIWLPLIAVAGITAMAASVAIATTADRRRVHYGRPTRSDSTGRNEHPK